MPLDNQYVVSPRNFPVFEWNKNYYGGTEYMASTFTKKVLDSLPKLKNYNCFILPGSMPPLSKIEGDNKEIILWMHNTIYQFSEALIKGFFNPRIVSKIKYIVVVSEFQKQETLKFLPIDPDKIIVIHNAIEPLKYDPTKFDNPKQVKIIHTSTAERGTHILINSLLKCEEDFRLEIYNDFYPHIYEDYVPDPRIRFYGKTPKPTVIEAIEASHIHAYPSVYPETFCLSQVEAMSAGLLCVTSDRGSLPEVTSKYGAMYPYEDDQMKHSDLFAEHLTNAIQKIKRGEWDPAEQVEFANSEYSWDRHKERWLELHDKL